MSQELSPPAVQSLIAHARENGQFTEYWQRYFSDQYAFLISYLSTGGIFVPNLTVTQRDTILTPSNGLILYASDIDELQVRKAGAWKNILTT